MLAVMSSNAASGLLRRVHQALTELIFHALFLVAIGTTVPLPALSEKFPLEREALLVEVFPDELRDEGALFVAALTAILHAFPLRPSSMALS